MRGSAHSINENPPLLGTWKGARASISGMWGIKGNKSGRRRAREFSFKVRALGRLRDVTGSIAARSPPSLSLPSVFSPASSLFCYLGRTSAPEESRIHVRFIFPSFPSLYRSLLFPSSVPPPLSPFGWREIFLRSRPGFKYTMRITRNSAGGSKFRSEESFPRKAVCNLGG